MKQLSETATRLLTYLKSVGRPAWETTCMEAIFEHVKYSKETAAEHRQWSVNAYGGHYVRAAWPDGPDAEAKMIEFSPTVEVIYLLQTSYAMKELIAAGLADYRNGGDNNYIYFLV